VDAGAVFAVGDLVVGGQDMDLAGKAVAVGVASQPMRDGRREGVPAWQTESPLHEGLRDYTVRCG
jgi:hypothetical protein